MWVKILNDYIVDSAVLPNNSINATPDVDLSDIDWYYLEELPKPSIDPLNEKAVDVTNSEPVVISNNKVQQKWEIVILSPEEKQQARYNPDDFLLGLNQNQAYQTWSGSLPPNPYANFLLAVQRASESRNWVHVQTFYDGFKQATPPSAEALIEWQAIAVQYGIPIIF